ncbi:hypothetical protein KBX19_02640 [Corynebacterium sp. CCUG 71335]|uniref:hypothetical protein n=1 Tax=Corynebacterium sp. CCUG 71335 TaxID=2823892 RepID=UPI00210BF8B4|nr:hypothetical protein [Corynebacterium sp. CCUG 71335]MCQ4620115.1 hypothetical protein [Corynebacterium sp. CCUG 71335]
MPSIPSDRPDHPENDLHGAADYYNKVRPEPRSFDELASEPDPAQLNERNQASTRQAIWFGVAAVAGTFLIAGILALIFRLVGGPLCEAGEATWLCSQAARTWWAALSSIYPVVALLSCAVIMVRKLNRYERWMPWMGVFWLPLVPFTMLWLTVTVGMLAADYAP